MPASGPSVNGISAIKSYPIAQLADRTLLWNSAVHSAPVLYVFNAASTVAADDDLVLMPSGNPAAGRWIKYVPPSSGGGGGGVIVDSASVTTITVPGGYNTPGPIFPTLRPTVTPSAIGETRYVFRKYTVASIDFNGFSTLGLILTRSAYFTAIGLTAADWQCDQAGLIDLEYTTENGNPIANDPFTQETNELRIEPDYAGQRVVTRAATSAVAFHNGTRQARVVSFTTNLPVAGSSTQWWEWGN